MKTAKDFAIDSIIQSKANKNRKGTVLANNMKDGNGVLAVEWDDGSLAKVNINDIEESLSLEEEFKLLQNEVNAKLSQAATLIREANNLAVTHGKNLRSVNDKGPGASYDYLFNQDVLEWAMEDAGWRTSSWHC